MKKPGNDLKVMVYRGVDVSIDSQFRFYANVGGQYHTGGSWETLRKKLDKAVMFEPFDALRLDHTGIVQIRVTALDMEDSEWVVKKDGHTHGGTRIKFYHQIYGLDMREHLELWLAENENWNKIESDIETAKRKMQEELVAKALPRPDST